MNFRHRKKRNLEISITPMIDVVFLLLIFFIILLIFFLIELEECLLLNLILNVAFANLGITLSVELSISILVISRFVG